MPIGFGIVSRTSVSVTVVVAPALFVAVIFVGADSMSRAAEVPTYIADILVAAALLFMVLALALTRFRMVRG